MLVLGLIGAALLDGAITPAISIPSAVEGLKVDAPHLGPFVLPIPVVILGGLFVVQAKGTGSIGRSSRSVMVVWNVSIAVLESSRVRHAAVLDALDFTRTMAFALCAALPVSLDVLGSVFLAVTGERRCTRLWDILRSADEDLCWR